mmetsp:Transcript_59708/g.169846  ORF Transcript_59708/g.169846 Transcript_59708/m.169846 type:complete len:209 (-) Transcript_59708:702-1328(-)
MTSPASGGTDKFISSASWLQRVLSASMASFSPLKVTKALFAFTVRAFSESTKFLRFGFVSSSDSEDSRSSIIGKEASLRIRFFSARALASRSLISSAMARQSSMSWALPSSVAPFICVFLNSASSSFSFLSFSSLTIPCSTFVLFTTWAASMAPSGKKRAKKSVIPRSQQSASGTPSTSTVVDRGGCMASSHAKRYVRNFRMALCTMR